MADSARRKGGAKQRQELQDGIAALPTVKKTAARFLPSELAEFIGERPLLIGEDPAEYDAILENVANAVTPEDAIEWIWVKDIVDAVWERRRAQIMRRQLVEMNRYQAAVSLIARLSEDGRDAWGKASDSAKKRARRWTERGAKGHVEMAAFLAEHGLDERAVATETFLSRAAGIEQLDRMIEAADKRRDAVIREIERRRASRAPTFQNVADQIDRRDAEDVAPDDTASAAPVRRVSNQR